MVLSMLYMIGHVSDLVLPMQPGQVDSDQPTPPEGLLAPTADVPWTLTGTPSTDRFHRFLATHRLRASASTQAAYLSGALLVEALSRAGTEQLTGGRILSLLWHMPTTTLNGLTPPLRFTAEQPTAPNSCYFGARFTKGQWIAVKTKSLPLCS